MNKRVFKEPTVAQKRELRRELEKLDLAKVTAGKSIIPTDFAELALFSCYGIEEDEFFDLGEGEISNLASEVITRIFFKAEAQKKS